MKPPLDPYLNNVRVGTSATAASVGQTNLVSPIAGNEPVSFVSADDRKVRGFFFTIPFNKYNGNTIRELGIICRKRDMFSRVLIGSVVKDNTVQISGYWDISSEPVTTYKLTVNTTNVTSPTVDVNGLKKTGSSVEYESLMPGTYNVIVSHAGYVDYNGTVTIDGNNKTMSVTLEEIILARQVTFVMTPNWGTITGAVLNINGRNISQTTPTNIPLTIDVGIYPYTVTAPNYNTVSGNLTVPNSPESTTHSVNLVHKRYIVTFNVVPCRR